MNLNDSTTSSGAVAALYCRLSCDDDNEGEKFIDLVRKYLHITELTPQILNEFIDKVTVHQAVKVDGKRRRDIDVYFNGVGQMLPPRQISPDEKSPKQPSKRPFRALAGLYIPNMLPLYWGLFL